MSKDSSRIAVLGAGQIGSVIADLLASLGHIVSLADSSAEQLKGLADARFATTVLDVADGAALRLFLADKDVVVSACPYFLNKGIAAAAVDSHTHYFDLTEDVEVTTFIKELGRTADVALVPQCGLAPGFICVLGADMARRFDSVKSIKMRVGALPRYPTNALRYNVTWSIDGLINEYCNPCEMIFDGQSILVPALEGLEQVMIDGVAYEAFNTSGGLGTLTETLRGRVADMSYKTLRYPGHADIMRLLLRGLDLANDRPTIKRILQRAAPFTQNDVVIVFVTGIGERGERIQEDSFVLRYEGTRNMGAIQLTTAAGCIAMIELFLDGKLPNRGFVRQEDARLDDYLATTAGGWLAQRAHPGSTTASESAACGPGFGAGMAAAPNALKLALAS